MTASKSRMAVILCAVVAMGFAFASLRQHRPAESVALQPRGAEISIPPPIFAKPKFLLTTQELVSPSKPRVAGLSSKERFRRLRKGMLLWEAERILGVGPEDRNQLDLIPTISFMSRGIEPRYRYRLKDGSAVLLRFRGSYRLETASMIGASPSPAFPVAVRSSVELPDLIAAGNESTQHVETPEQLFQRLEPGMFQHEVERLLDVDGGIAVSRGEVGRSDRWAYYLPSGVVVIADYQGGFLKNANLCRTTVSPEFILTTHVTASNHLGGKIDDLRLRPWTHDHDTLLKERRPEVSKPLFLITPEKIVTPMTLPKESTVRLRLGELRKGMTKEEVEQKLGLRPAPMIPTVSLGRIFSHYRLRGPRTLIVAFSLDGFESARFSR